MLKRLASILSRVRLVTAAAAPSIVVGAAVPAAAGDQAILLMPLGTFRMRDGREFTVGSLADARAIVAASLAYAGGTDIPIDYDHQLVFGVGKGNGGTAPAAGWIKRLYADADGIKAEVQWTETAAAHLADGAYRYISPSFIPDAKGRVARIVNAGLVNFPAITDLPAVASTQETSVEPMMKIAEALGLPGTATLDEILAAVAKMAPATAMTEKVTAAAAALGLAAGADLDAVVTAAVAAASKSPDPAKFVPIEALADVNAQLKVLQGDRIAGIVTAAVQAGKISPALLGWANDLAARDLPAFQAFVAAAPAIVAPGALPGLETAAARTDGLTPDEVRVAAKVGVTPEAFAAAKPK